MVDVSDMELALAKARWQAERASRPIPSSVRFDAQSERVIVEFTNGASFIFPARAVEGLRHATTEQLEQVELLGETGLHWEDLDADYTIAGLMNGIFGSKAFMDAQRRGGPVALASESRRQSRQRRERRTSEKGGARRLTSANLLHRLRQRLTHADR